nr:mannan endo-1,6-alpha-mannosidase dcw1 [Quercus suber]
MHLSWQRASVTALLLAPSALAIDLDVNDAASLTSAAKSIASGIISIYNSRDSTIPGVMPAPYYWWEAGLTFDSLINYWALTNDSSYVDLTRDALVWQMDDDASFMPANQTKSEGNDDQSTWALAAMTAAERGFPAPSNNVSWLEAAQNVFDKQTVRWDTTTCGGGLRWQIFTFNNGYNYKNALTEGNFMQLAARLARFTGNQTYTQWAQRTLDWTNNVGMIENGTVYDGTIVTDNCTEFEQIPWTSNYGTMLSAASYMVNYTHEQQWMDTASSIFQKMQGFFLSSSTDQILIEVACAPSRSCNTDAQAYLAILARALANQRALTANANSTTTTSGQTTAILQDSAVGAARQCVEQNGTFACGTDWTQESWDGTSGLGQSLSALEVILANLPQVALKTSTSDAGTVTGGSAPGDGNATTASTSPSPSVPVNGASVKTGSIFAVVGALGLAVLL